MADESMDMLNQNQERIEELRKEHLKSILNASPNRHAALDLFLMLDEENDHYLKFDEIAVIWPVIEKLPKEDQGKITSLEDLQKNFNDFGNFQIDR
jgi:hypothetical protein